jgi:ribosomal protein S18 acetylase RimI-like enzyme
VQLSLHVSVLNPAAQNLYKKFGFTVSQWLPEYYSKKEDGLLMVKML